MPTPSPSKIQPPTPAPPPRGDAVSLVRWLLNLPRIVRMILAIAFAFAVTLILTPIIDFLYLTFIYSENTELERTIHSNLPAIIEVALGGVMYVIGWTFFIGPSGEKPPARPVVLWYFGIGVFAVFMVLLWVIQGMALGTSPM